MAMAPPERSKTLHNFSLPCLKWGSQRVLRCVKVPPPPPSHDLLPPPPLLHRHPSSSTNAAAAAAVLDGLMIQPRPTIPTPVQHKPTSSPDRIRLNGTTAEDDSSPRPWNLRTRRAACKAPVRAEEIKGAIIAGNFRGESSNGAPDIDSSRAKRQCLETPPQPPPAIRQKIRRLCVPLSKEEIEEDFFQIARIRPPRRPKKRPRIVQKYMDLTFPGLWLTEVTADLYKVPEVPES